MATEELWGREGVLTFPIDCDAVLKHLKQDMRDDWFLDTILYQDLFANTSSLQGVISDLLVEENGQYLGACRHIYDVPKKGLGIRYSLETDFYDRFIYQAICSYLIVFFDPLLSNRVLGHRFNKKRKEEKYLFKNRIELWRTFEGVTHTALTSDQALLATDLINYFENISISNIKSAFLSRLNAVKANGKEKLRIRNAVETLCLLLKRWSYSNKHGLPQNRDASSFIANVVLCDVDHKMEELGYDYYRYVDDIRIVCTDQRHARKALTDLIGELRKVGMNINSAKTEILTKDSDVQRIAEFFPTVDDRSLTIDNMWRSRSRRVIARSVSLIYEMLREIIEQKETQSRQFRFAVNRLKILIESAVFDASSDLAESLTNLIIDALETQPASTDQFCRMLSILELSSSALQSIEDYVKDPLRSIHSWQNYHLWLLLARKKLISEDLTSVALTKMQDSIFSPEIPAIFIYLKSVGQEDNLKPIVAGFSGSWPYQHQRYSLLSTKDFDREILKPIVEFLGIKVKGTAKRASRHLPSDGTLVSASEPIDVLNFYDYISPYE